MRLSLLPVFTFWLTIFSWCVDAQDVCAPCADGLDAFLDGKVCEVGVAVAANYTSESAECKPLQLALFQGGCCDTPPENFCTLCENGSENYNLDKVIPPGPRSPPIEVTCQDYATRDQYLTDSTLAICNDTARERARAWCECDGVQPACTLTCEDGNPPPDLTKSDPVFGVTCERWVFEYTTLTEQECKDSTSYLTFNGKAFCCGEPAPNECSVCPEGQMIGDSEKVVQTEFFGDVTCGEIATYAGYLPSGGCSIFIGDLLDDPFGAEAQCCVEGSSSSGVNRFSAKTGTLVAFTLVLSFTIQSGLQSLLFWFF